MVYLISTTNDIYNKYSEQYSARYGWKKSLGEDFYTFGYIEFYKSTADVLVNQYAPDLYIFPIMFSYRQYLELVLKNICYRNMEKEQYSKLIRRASHNLRIVWIEASKFLVNYNTTEQMQIIDEMIKIFHQLDPNSFTFRYEFNKVMGRTIKEDQLHI